MVRILVLGPIGSGKTTLLHTIFKEKSTMSSVSSGGCTTHVRSIITDVTSHVNPPAFCFVEVNWSTDSSEIRKKLRELYYVYFSALVIVVDASDRKNASKTAAKCFKEIADEFLFREHQWAIHDAKSQSKDRSKTFVASPELGTGVLERRAVHRLQKMPTMVIFNKIDSQDMSAPNVPNFPSYPYGKKSNAPASLSEIILQAMDAILFGTYHANSAVSSKLDVIPKSPFHGKNVFSVPMVLPASTVDGKMTVSYPSKHTPKENPIFGCMSRDRKEETYFKSDLILPVLGCGDDIFQYALDVVESKQLLPQRSQVRYPEFPLGSSGSEIPKQYNGSFVDPSLRFGTSSRIPHDSDASHHPNDGMKAISASSVYRNPLGHSPYASAIRRFLCLALMHSYRQYDWSDEHKAHLEPYFSEAIDSPLHSDSV